jgi:hypothetical protein
MEGQDFNRPVRLERLKALNQGNSGTALAPGPLWISCGEDKMIGTSDVGASIQQQHHPGPSIRLSAISSQRRLAIKSNVSILRLVNTNS